ncbi:E3 ubiquitin-protein ligase RHA2A-like [Impatiens glandulifera]|uniref:E3 ubiquitin-protein ligase RHA2A-like n=1 Tax=Impatiens glandulifera TaxID=253017 RepID=UPI001FB0FF25|nr:E3 ubiquitin-protein ligase RHA2A-like [Impatiens glandulifera]
MGLIGHVSDCSTESIPILVIVIIAKFISYLRSKANAVFHSLGFFKPSDQDDVDRVLLMGDIGSGLGNLTILAEQLSVNRVISETYGFKEGEPEGLDSCIVCLSCLREGDQVRRLECRHVFHKKCFDGWLDHLNFNCPLCRTMIVSKERVAEAHRKANRDAAAFLYFR